MILGFKTKFPNGTPTEFIEAYSKLARNVKSVRRQQITET